MLQEQSYNKHVHSETQSIHQDKFIYEIGLFVSYYYIVRYIVERVIVCVSVNYILDWNDDLAAIFEAKLTYSASFLLLS